VFTTFADAGRLIR